MKKINVPTIQQVINFYLLDTQRKNFCRRLIVIVVFASVVDEWKTEEYVGEGWN